MFDFRLISLDRITCPNICGVYCICYQKVEIICHRSNWNGWKGLRQLKWTAPVWLILPVLYTKNMDILRLFHFIEWVMKGYNSYTSSLIWNKECNTKILFTFMARKIKRITAIIDEYCPHKNLLQSSGISRKSGTLIVRYSQKEEWISIVSIEVVSVTSQLPSLRYYYTLFEIIRTWTIEQYRDLN